ncbi:hypothetical protein E1262_20120 [Jiangella aurantiaca]|uniref:MmcQ/YjbR family DNA-binding protein n=1 Tax=Jiangella aurantiaca TaxID=2530373 RepID=A0A4R5A7N2_9ACTN|nr:hypothetical protein [Jiangella aurantiaca]TDD67086.1 hypothetical protein E1262_20120 [Jiangella aurantiaca]
MAPDAKGTFPPDRSGGDAARDLYEELTDDLLYDPAIGRATMMGYPCVRLAGRFLACYDDKAGRLVLKLPSERVVELVRAGTGDEFAPAGRVFREWVAIPTADRELWRVLLAEAVAFARTAASGRS